MELQRLDYDFSICKISNVDNVDFSREFVFLSKTNDEISLVCETSHIPSNTIISDSGWKAFKVSGMLDFGMIGVVAKISDILAKAEISIFVVSTYNTDYIFLKAENFDKGIQVLIFNGYIAK